MNSIDALSEFIEDEKIRKAERLINVGKLHKQFPGLPAIKDEEYVFLNEFLETLEFAAIDLWNPEKEDSQKFRNLCNSFVDVSRILPLPKDDLEKVKYVLRMITYSYLGENWEVVRRYLIENETKLLVDCDCDKWNERLFRTIYLAIFYLIRKHSWEDLEKSINQIKILRTEQRRFEETYLESQNDIAKAAAFELGSLYHLAKAVELVSDFQLKGRPADISVLLAFHFDHAIKYAESGNIIELNLILRMLKPTFEKMIGNSIWMVANKVNSKVKNFVDLLIRASEPIIEFMYPQRYSILEKGLLDPTHRALVINLPTSSGKTLIAEFRILQALNQFSEERGWVAYVAPTRALVNQITARLKRDLSQDPLNLRVAKISGVLEIDAYEEDLIKRVNDFDVLVTTPEKLNLLVRQDIEAQIDRPLVLTVVDEVHNIESTDRGMNLETLLSIVRTDCERANFLLMTPVIPNPDDLARWLDPQNFRSINMTLQLWKPNDMLVGMFYGWSQNQNISTYFKPLITSNETMVVDEIPVETDSKGVRTHDLNVKYKLAALLASQLYHHDNVLVISRSKKDTYRIAEFLYDNVAETEDVDEIVRLVQRFIAAELGEKFPLIRYLDKRIGIHHSGLPDDIRYLMELLMEEGSLKYLIATTTIAQGMNFNVSTILMATYSYPFTAHMPTRDFWNLAGRVGRIYSNSPGVVGIAVKNGSDSEDALKLMKFLELGTEDLVSALVRMVNETIERGRGLNLKELYNEPEWSMFLQYISHMFKQSRDLSEFIARTEMTLRRTYGYDQLSDENKKLLLNSVREYAAELNKGIATLADSTGLCPETIKSISREVRGQKLTKSDWKADSMFSSSPDSLRKLVGIMLRTPEIKKQLRDIKIRGQQIAHYTLSKLISAWVRGNDIPTISKTYFGSDHHENISDCVSAIYGKLVLSAAWGLSAFQKLSQRELDFENLSEKEKKQLSNLPAMIYYGVNTDEAILLRKANVPRSISQNLGTELKSQFGDEVYTKTVDETSKWLVELPETRWQSAVPPRSDLTGKDYKKIWQLLSGESRSRAFS